MSSLKNYMNKDHDVIILACESSCDETAFALYNLTQKKLLDHTVYSQIVHESFGGVVPEEASKEHIAHIDTLCAQLLRKNNILIDEIDYFAVTGGPGLPGSLLIGIGYMKGLALKNKKKCIPVNHLEGHIYSPCLENKIEFPHVCVSVSGGHTSLYYVKNEIEYRELATTMDDAAGECLDKIAKLLNLGYPGGPIIEKLALENNFKDIRQYPRLKKNDFSFSFSGLKTAVLYDLVKEKLYDLETKKISSSLSDQLKRDICSSLLCAVNDIIISRIILALENFCEIKAVTCVGGVACNSFIQKNINELAKKKSIKCYIPSKKLCTDNAAMIVQVAAFKILNNSCDSYKNDTVIIGF